MQPKYKADKRNEWLAYQPLYNSSYPNTVTQVSSSRSSIPIDSLQQNTDINVLKSTFRLHHNVNMLPEIQTKSRTGHSNY